MVDRIKVAYLTPLPPVKSGIASYSIALLPHLGKRCELTAVVSQTSVSDSAGVPVIDFAEFERNAARFDAVVCQIGNNPHHEVFYRRALANSSIVVLHDIVLHHLVVEMTLARGDVEAYVDALRRNHGEAGAAWARGRAAGLHNEIGNFLFPASIEVANKSRHVIVHNRHAAETLQRLGVQTPITVTGHPRPVVATRGDRQATRERHGFGDEDVVIAMFGFVTGAKRPEKVFEAFGRAARENRRLKLLVVGEPAPNIKLQQLAGDSGLAPDAWSSTGFVSDEDFDVYLAAVDKVVNLRYPSAGETSGPLMHVFALGRDVAVSDYASFAELPNDVVTKIPLGEWETEALTSFMLDEVRDRSGAQAAWLAKNGDAETIASHYLAAVEAGSASREPRSRVDVPGDERNGRLIALFPEWEIRDAIIDGDRARFVLDNRGAAIAAPLYGAPAYRVIAKAYDGAGAVVFDRWIAPRRDIFPGGAFEIELALPENVERVELIHGLESVETVNTRPFAEARR